MPFILQHLRQSATKSDHTSQPPILQNVQNVQTLTTGAHDPSLETDLLAVRASPLALPGLPLELIYIIFDFAASKSHAACKALCQVSYGSRTTVLQYLMRTIVVWRMKYNWVDDERVKTSPESGCCREWIMPSFYTKRVGFEPRCFSSASTISLIFARCPNVRDIALGGPAFQQMIDGNAYKLLKSKTFRIMIHRYSLCVRLLPGTDHHHSFLNQVTHLTVGGAEDEQALHGKNMDLSRFQALENLKLVGLCTSSAHYLSNYVLPRLKAPRTLKRITLTFKENASMSDWIPRLEAMFKSRAPEPYHIALEFMTSNSEQRSGLRKRIEIVV